MFCIALLCFVVLCFALLCVGLCCFALLCFGLLCSGVALRPGVALPPAARHFGKTLLFMPEVWAIWGTGRSGLWGSSSWGDGGEGEE